MRRLLLGLLALSLALASVAGGILPAEATPCTAGTDCYCDCVNGPAGGGTPGYKNAACQTKGVPVDSSKLVCEDFEAPTLNVPIGQEAARVGNGAPYYGPPYDNTGNSIDRGHNGYWNNVWHNGVDGMLWQANTPASPTYGVVCNPSPPGNGAPCTGLGIWDVTDRWQANSFSRAAFLADTEFSADVATITRPTGSAGGGTGAFDGRVSYGLRIPTHVEAGGSGWTTWAASRTIGITQAVAYANNYISAGMMRGMQKHNEWQPADNGMFLFGFVDQRTGFPFYGFFWHDPGAGGSCAASLAAATQTVGTFQCNGSGDITWFAPGTYDFDVDWGLSKWGCVQGHYQNIGLANMAWTITLTGPSGIPKVITQISNFDGRFLYVNTLAAGVSGFNFNNYANANNQDNPPNIQTQEPTYRYEDNLHIRAGAPVPCAQIGYAAGPVITPPPTPINPFVTVP